MKISKSKRQLAQLLIEAGVTQFPDGANWAAQDRDKDVDFFENKPKRTGRCWMGAYDLDDRVSLAALIPNWHQTILSRDEYFHLYPAPDADGWIEYDGAGSPYSNDDIVEAKWSDGDFTCRDNFGPGRAWIIEDGGPNITHHRLHKPAQAKPELCESVMRSIQEPSDKPTIEQLVADYRDAKCYADRKQQEADTAKSDADAKLVELVSAGKALGLVLSVVASES